MFVEGKMHTMLFSALEQFDNVTFILYNFIWEILEKQDGESYSFFSYYLFDFNQNFFKDKGVQLFQENIGSTSSLMILFFLLIGFWFVQTFVVKNNAKFKNEKEIFSEMYEISNLCFIAVVIILSGFVFTAWFSDLFIFEVQVVEGLKNEFSFDYLVLPVSLPQIAFSISWDENIVSFFGALLLLDEVGAEEYVLEEEEGGLVEDVVAPLFISNLGVDIEQNGALFLKVCSIFSFVLINNLMGMLPYSDTGTSSLILTFWVAFAVFGSLLTLMFKKHGVNYFFSLFMPSGCPLPLIFVLIPIEFISYSFRLVSLSVRLFANMMAGHTLLKVIVGFSWSMILIGDIFWVANIFPILILFVLTFLEVGVALIQSYIFTILTCIYLKDIFVAH